MFDRIKSELYLRHGIRVESKQIWLIGALLFSVLVLLVSLIANWRASSSKFDPKNVPAVTQPSKIPRVR